MDTVISNSNVTLNDASLSSSSPDVNELSSTSEDSEDYNEISSSWSTLASSEDYNEISSPSSTLAGSEDYNEISSPLSTLESSEDYNEISSPSSTLAGSEDYNEISSPSSTLESSEDYNEISSPLSTLAGSEDYNEISSPLSTLESSEDYNEMSSSNSELIELQVLLISMLKGLKMDEFIKFLRAKKDTADRSYRAQNAAVSGCSVVSAVGGVTMFVGSVSALVTLGASLSLVIAGGVTVGVGTFGTITAQITSKLHRKLIIWQCKKELKKIESHTKKIGDVYEQFREKCIVVCKTLEELELSIENLKELDPIIFKFALIGSLNMPKVAAIAGAAGTHVATTARAGHFVHLRFLGKALIPAFKITEAVLGIGMAMSGIGIALDLMVGGKAFYDLVKGTECSESRGITEAINLAEEHTKLINSFLHLLEHDAKDLLTKAIDSTKDQQRAEIEHLRRAEDESRAEIE